MVNALLLAGANVNVQSNVSKSPVCALDYLTLSFFNQFILHRIIFFLQNGKTALHGAAEKGHLEIVNALLQAGADVNLQNNVRFPKSIFILVSKRSDNLLIGFTKRCIVQRNLS